MKFSFGLGVWLLKKRHVTIDVYPQLTHSSHTAGGFILAFLFLLFLLDVLNYISIPGSGYSLIAALIFWKQKYSVEC